MIWNNKKIISLFVIPISLGFTLYSLTLPNIYKAEAVLMSIDKPSGGAAAGSGLFKQIITGKTEDIVIISILRSRSLTERVIEKLDLYTVFYGNRWNQSKALNPEEEKKKYIMKQALITEMSSIVTVGKRMEEGTIMISCLAKDPELSAKICNTYLQELEAFIAGSILTKAKRNRIFLKSQLESNIVDILEIGKEIKGFYGNGSNKMAANEKLYLNIDVDKMKNGKLNIAEKHHEQMDDLLDKKESYKNELEKIKIATDVPKQVYFDYLVTYHGILMGLHSLLATQYEMVKIDESRDDILFSIIDNATTPIGRYKPNRRQIVIISFLAALSGAVLFVFLRENFLKEKKIYTS